MRTLIFSMASLVLCGAASAQTPAENYRAAWTKFQTLQAESVKKGTPPRRAEPGVAETLDVLANKAGDFGTSGFAVGPETLEVCDIANRTVGAYRLFGLEAAAKEAKIGGPEMQNQIAALIAKVQEKNIPIYQDEITPVLNFLTRCTALTMPALADFIARLPPEQMTDTRRAGLAKMRSGVQMQLVSAVLVLGDKEVRRENRVAIRDTIIRYLNAFVSLLALNERAALKERIMAMRASATDEQSETIDVIAKALDDKTCEKLCKF